MDERSLQQWFPTNPDHDALRPAIVVGYDEELTNPQAAGLDRTISRSVYATARGGSWKRPKLLFTQNLLNKILISQKRLCSSWMLVWVSEG